MLVKAKIVVLSTKEEIPVMYNPTELQDNRTVQVNGSGAEIQFQKVITDDLTVSLFFDTYETATDVRSLTNKIAALTNPTTGTGLRKEPPVCMFVWSQVWFTGIITKLDQKFVMFLASGIPVRAELTVTFKPVLTEKAELESRGYWNCRRLWTVKKDDRLYLIAREVFGDAKLWRLIALENKIYDVLNFPRPEQIGTTIVIPDIHVNAH